MTTTPATRTVRCPHCTAPVAPAAAGLGRHLLAAYTRDRAAEHARPAPAPAPPAPGAQEWLEDFTARAKSFTTIAGHATLLAELNDHAHLITTGDVHRILGAFADQLAIIALEASQVNGGHR
jgi:hypothetical protein